MDENIDKIDSVDASVENAEPTQDIDNDLSTGKTIEKKIKKPRSNVVENSNQSQLDKVEKGNDLYNDDSQRGKNNLDFLMDIPLSVSVEIGRAKIAIKDLLQLGANSVIELDKAVGEPLDLLINDKLVARGEVVVFDENFGIRITDIVKSEDRIKSLG